MRRWCRSQTFHLAIASRRTGGHRRRHRTVRRCDRGTLRLRRHALARSGHHSRAGRSTACGRRRATCARHVRRWIASRRWPPTRWFRSVLRYRCCACVLSPREPKATRSHTGASLPNIGRWPRRAGSKDIKQSRLPCHSAVRAANSWSVVTRWRLCWSRHGDGSASGGVSVAGGGPTHWDANTRSV